MIPRAAARRFAALDTAGKRRFIEQLSDSEAALLQYTWEAWARDNQLAPPGAWVTWLNMGGRGSGKTRTGAEWLRQQKERYGRLHIVGRTAADVRDVMIDGESGLLAISPPWDRPTYQPSRRRVVWDNGATAITFSADEPESLRGPQCERAWCDEIGAWQYEEAWDQMMFGLRLGDDPRVCATTTPRVTRLVKKLVTSPTTRLTHSTTYQNRANLAPTFFSSVITRFEHTRLGRQELEGQLIEDLEGALWKRLQLDDTRVVLAPELIRVVVAVDPPATSGEEAAEAGIIVAGLGEDQQGYILADASMRGSPNEWASAAVSAYHLFHADRLIGEVNNGGEMIEAIIRHIDPTIAYRAVRATRGKQLRAEPISSLYERGLCHHVGFFPELEDQQCNWQPGMTSPDRLDALVWALTDLMIGHLGSGGMVIDTDMRIEPDGIEAEDEANGYSLFLPVA